MENKAKFHFPAASTSMIIGVYGGETNAKVVLDISVGKDWCISTSIKSVPNDYKLSEADTDKSQINESAPKWSIAEAMDYVLHEMKFFADGVVSDMDEYKLPASKLTHHAVTGGIQVWGKRIMADGPELTSRAIDPHDWKIREIAEWAIQPYTRKPQTRSTTNSAIDQQFTDMHVFESEIKAIDWRN